MQKVIVVLLLFLIMSLASSAQSIEPKIENEENFVRRTNANFGVKLGANYSTAYDEQGEAFQADSKLGLATGVFFSLPIGAYIDFQPEVLFSQKGYKAAGSLLGNPYLITRVGNYLDVPFFVAIRPLEKLILLAGPQYSYLLAQKNIYHTGKTTASQVAEFNNEQLRKNLLCFTIGADLNFYQLVFGVRAGWDLLNNLQHAETATPRYKNMWYQFTLGYRFLEY